MEMDRRIGARLDTLPPVTDREIQRVRAPFDRGFAKTNDPFEKLVLEIDSGVRRSSRKFKKEVRWEIIAKLINQLKTVELKDYDEAKLLEETEKRLKLEVGKMWMEGWLLNKSAQEPAREPSQVPKITMTGTNLAPVNENATTMHPSQPDSPSGGKFLPVPAPTGHGVVRSRAGSYPISGSPSRVRRASEGNIIPEIRCLRCGQRDHYTLPNNLLQFQLLNAIVGCQLLISGLGQQTLNALNGASPETSIIIVRNDVQYQVQIREVGVRRSPDRWVVIFWVVLLVVSVILFVILPGVWRSSKIH